MFFKSFCRKQSLVFNEKIDAMFIDQSEAEARARARAGTIEEDDDG